MEFDEGEANQLQIKPGTDVTGNPQRLISEMWGTVAFCEEMRTRCHQMDKLWEAERGT